MIEAALSARAAADEVPERTALIDAEGAWSWRAAANETARRAAAFEEAGLRRGHSVAFAPAPDRDGVLDLVTLLGLDVGVVLVHPRWTERERNDAMARAQPTFVLEAGALHPSGPLDATGAADVVVFTSGSTGRPKGVRLSRRALVAAARAHAEALPFSGDDRWLLAMPLAHVGGLSVVTRALTSRTGIAVAPGRFDPAALLDAARRHRATLVSLVPTMLERLLASGGPAPPKIRAALLGGAACPTDLLARGRAAGWPLLPTYGMSEAAAQICTQRLGEERPTGVGPPLPGVRIRVVDGEIQVAGPTLMDGLLAEPSPFVDGWYRTGDLGFIDDTGHLHVHGRADRRIVSGGENVDPTEVEAALREHPAVRDVCVVGVDDPRWGQRVAAAIVGDVDQATLEAHLVDRLAGFKRPRTWVSLDALPVTPSGKVDLGEVRRRLE